MKPHLVPARLTRGTVLLAVVIACDASGPTAPPASVLGCHSLTVTNWSGPHESPDPPTPVILLDSLGSYLLETGRTLARPAPLGTPMSFDMAWWSHPEREQLDVVFSAGGYVGIRLSLRWIGPYWSGPAEAYTDVGPSVQATGVAVMRAVTCP